MLFFTLIKKPQSSQIQCIVSLKIIKNYSFSLPKIS
jgi:hypothetical protein